MHIFIWLIVVRRVTRRLSRVALMSPPPLKWHQSGHLWCYKRHWMGEVSSQWIINRIREANHGWRGLGQAGQRHRCADALAIQHGNPDDPLRGVGNGYCCCAAASLHVFGNLPLPLVPAVLKPDLHLGLGELQWGGQPGPLRAAQVAFQVESGLQLEDLAAAEHGAGFLLSCHFCVTWEEEEGEILVNVTGYNSWQCRFNWGGLRHNWIFYHNKGNSILHYW